VISVFASLGLPDQWERRRSEAEEASSRAGFEPVFLDPPLRISSRDDLALAAERVAVELPRIVADHGATLVVSPSPHEMHHGHETVARGVQRAVAAMPLSVRWWMWGVWADLAAPNIYFPFDEPDLARMLHILGAYVGEILRNDYRRLLIGRSASNAVLGSERVFGFGSPAASALPYAEVLTEVRRIGDRWMAAEAHKLDEGPLPEERFAMDLTAWIESPSASRLVASDREVPEPDDAG
jgi:hypothetical protein